MHASDWQVLRPASPDHNGVTGLSSKEQALWLFHQYATDSGILNVPFAMRFQQRLRWWPLNAALLAMARRHPNLRTLFPEADGMPRREVLGVDSPLLRQAPLQTRASREIRIDRDMADFVAQPFDLTAELPFRAAHFILEQVDILLVVVSHLVFDATSAAVLQEELLAAYSGLMRDNDVPAALTGSVMPPADREPPAASVGYWTQRLRGAPSGRLGLGSQAPRRSDFPGRRVVRVLNDQAAGAVTQLSQQLSASRNVVMFAAFVLVLSKHGAGDDVVVALPISDRGLPPHRAIGYYVNVLPARCQPAPARHVREFLRDTRDRFLTDLSHARLSAESLGVAYDDSASGQTPLLLRYMFNYDMESLAAESPADETAPAALHVPNHHSRLDLEFGVSDGEHPKLEVTYASDVFESAEALALVARFEQLLVRLTDHLDAVIDDIDCCTEADRQLLSSCPEVICDERGRPVPPGVRGQLRPANPDGEPFIGGRAARLRLDGFVELLSDAPESAAATADRQQPSELVAELIKEFQDLLQLTTADIDTNFFTYGGDSMLAARLVSRLKKSRGLKVSMRTVFQAPTPGRLALAVQAHRPLPRLHHLLPDPPVMPMP